MHSKTYILHSVNQMLLNSFNANDISILNLIPNEPITYKLVKTQSEQTGQIKELLSKIEHINHLIVTIKENISNLSMMAEDIDDISYFLNNLDSEIGKQELNNLILYFELAVRKLTAEKRKFNITLQELGSSLLTATIRNDYSINDFLHDHYLSSKKLYKDYQASSLISIFTDEFKMKFPTDETITNYINEIFKNHAIESGGKYYLNLSKSIFPLYSLLAKNYKIPIVRRPDKIKNEKDTYEKMIRSLKIYIDYFHEQYTNNDTNSEDHDTEDDMQFENHFQVNEAILQYESNTNFIFVLAALEKINATSYDDNTFKLINAISIIPDLNIKLHILDRISLVGCDDQKLKKYYEYTIIYSSILIPLATHTIMNSLQSDISRFSEIYNIDTLSITNSNQLNQACELKVKAFLISHLRQVKVFDGKHRIFDFINEIPINTQNKQVELIHNIRKHIGVQLENNDLIQIQELITELQFDFNYHSHLTNGEKKIDSRLLLYSYIMTILSPDLVSPDINYFSKFRAAINLAVEKFKLI